jgi:hypothetical protein
MHKALGFIPISTRKRRKAGRLKLKSFIPPYAHETPDQHMFVKLPFTT